MFSTTCEYALRALIRLTRLPNNTSVLGRHLASQAGIPVNYLSKILLTLRNAGLLTSARGTGGGYRLRKQPGEIRLIDVVELFDGARARPSCLLGGQDCSDQRPCSAHAAWRDIRAAYAHFLESTTLADIAKPSARGAAAGR
jgi:Rrf2 family protein